MSSSDEESLRTALRGLRVFGTELPHFDPTTAPDTPGELFTQWLLAAIAADVPGPHAMVLSTVDPQGAPNSRVLILKGLVADRWQFASSRSSPKGCELATAPVAAANFHWPTLARQVRIRGLVREGSPDDGTRDFRARPDSSRAESLLGRQSEPLIDPSELDAALTQALAQVRADPELSAPHWRLYELHAQEVEFWQGDAERRHVRLQYERTGEQWRQQLLWP